MVSCPLWSRWKHREQKSVLHLLQWISIAFLWSLHITFFAAPTLVLVWLRIAPLWHEVKHESQKATPHSMHSTVASDSSWQSCSHFFLANGASLFCGIGLDCLQVGQITVSWKWTTWVPLVLYLQCTYGGIGSIKRRGIQKGVPALSADRVTTGEYHGLFWSTQ